MEWFVPLIMEVLGGIYDWSEPHVIRVRQIIDKVQSYSPQLTPFAMQEVVPLLSKVLGDDIDQIASLNELISKMLPKKKKK